MFLFETTKMSLFAQTRQRASVLRSEWGRKQAHMKPSFTAGAPTGRAPVLGVNLAQQLSNKSHFTMNTQPRVRLLCKVSCASGGGQKAQYFASKQLLLRDSLVWGCGQVERSVDAFKSHSDDVAEPEARLRLLSCTTRPPLAGEQNLKLRGSQPLSYMVISVLMVCLLSALKSCDDCRYTH